MIVLSILAAILLVLILLILCLIFSQVQVAIHFTYRHQRQDLYIQLILWKYIKLTRSIPIIDLNTDTFSVDLVEKDEMFGKQKEKKKSFTIDDLKQQWTLINEVIKTTKDVLPHLKKALKAIQVNQFNWDTMLGVSRADHTAELTGVLYTVKGGIAALMLNYLTLSTNPNYTVQPYYVKPTYQTELKCILSFKLGKIMRELYSVGKQYGKLKKVGLK